MGDSEKKPKVGDGVMVDNFHSGIVTSTDGNISTVDFEVGNGTVTQSVYNEDLDICLRHGGDSM